MAIVYQHRRLDTDEIFYIGIGKEESRAYSKINRNKYWRNIVDKYNYQVEITHQDIIWEEACVIEKYLISFWGRKDLGQGPLVNMTDGGDGKNGVIQSEETKQKMSISQKGRTAWNKGKKQKPLTEEQKEKLKGRIPWNKGKKLKPFSEETKQKMSESRKGRIFSEESKQKISESLKGKTAWNKGKKLKPFSEETKQKMSESRKGRIPWNKGKKQKPLTQEHKQKISESKKRLK
jgi:hypothetical protein